MADEQAVGAAVDKPPASLFDVYRWLRSELDAPSRRALRLCCTAARAAHDREEPAIHARTSTSDSDHNNNSSSAAAGIISVPALSVSLGGILSRGCRPDRLSLGLELRDPDAQERGMAALDCFAAAGASSVTQFAAQHLEMTPAAAAAVTAAAPGLAVLRLAGCTRLPALPAVVLSVRSTLRSLSLEGCGGGSWPADLGQALESCANLEHLTLLLPCGPGAAPPAAAAPSAPGFVVPPLAPVCEALTRLTQLRSLSLDLRLPSCDDASYDDAVSYHDGVDAAAAAATLARGVSALTRLSSVELGEAGSLPHPEWRLELLGGLAALPKLRDLSWRRLECDPEAAFALAASSSLTSLSVEKFRTEAPLAAVALAAAAAATATPAEPAQPDDGALSPRAAASAAAAAASGRPAAALSPQQEQQRQRRLRLLLPLPPQLQHLQARYSGLGGVSLAALAALQPPPGLSSLVLRNPKLEIADTDVDQPAAARLLPEAALALGMGFAKLAAHCPELQVLRIINETRQRNALAGPVGWAEANGGSDRGAAGGGHAPWLSSVGKLRALRRLTLSGLRLGRVDVEALARHAPWLEELYLVPMGSVSSAAVPVLRDMGLRRLSLPYERHA